MRVRYLVKLGFVNFQTSSFFELTVEVNPSVVTTLFNKTGSCSTAI